MSNRNEITRLLADWKKGDQTALDKLLPIVYDELHRLASHHMRRERPGHTLQTTALVHEAYLRLVGQQNVRPETRIHFFAAAAQVMRHILVDHARGHARAKRGGGAPSVPLDEAAVLSAARADELLAVNDALIGLTALDARKGQVFELRYFGGLSVDEAAEALQISPRTVARDWSLAKAWLSREMGRSTAHGA
jgi:RNA polymerase sigma factor (TIGR02999 family)